ncbi:MAG: hypothetical protein HYW62_00020 [Candidatus Levybacteria bacterium]|nr:hypothetical protein [Candidatus Levybacteria bacterium]
MRPASNKIDPKVKDVLMLLGAGTFLAASIIMPGLPMALKPFLDEQRKREKNEWKKFNTWRLKQVLKRLHDQKLIEIAEINDGHIVKISDKGKKKILKFNIEDIELDQRNWDGKWRIIIYDIYTGKKQERELFRKTLKRLKFLKLQKSVYLTPFKCHDEIEYLRQVCNIGNEVLILTVSRIENEPVYKEYFGI